MWAEVQRAATLVADRLTNAVISPIIGQTGDELA
jgi:hypothetical protein